jgi:hypothetical protein
MVCKVLVLAGPVNPETPADKSNCCACAGLPSRKISANATTKNDSFFKVTLQSVKAGRTER